jgi:hypothetical protein
MIGSLSPGTSPLEPVVHPTTQASVSDCSIFLIMCDAPSTVVFAEKLLNAFLVLYTYFLDL